VYHVQRTDETYKTSSASVISEEILEETYSVLWTKAEAGSMHEVGVYRIEANKTVAAVV